MPSQIDFEKAHGNDGHIELAGLRWAARASKVTDSMANSVWQRKVGLREPRTGEDEGVAVRTVGSRGP